MAAVQEAKQHGGYRGANLNTQTTGENAQNYIWKTVLRGVYSTPGGMDYSIIKWAREHGEGFDNPRSTLHHIYNRRKFPKRPRCIQLLIASDLVQPHPISPEDCKGCRFAEVNKRKMKNNPCTEGYHPFKGSELELDDVPSTVFEISSRRDTIRGRRLA